MINNRYLKAILGAAGVIVVAFGGYYLIFGTADRAAGVDLSVAEKADPESLGAGRVEGLAVLAEDVAPKNEQLDTAMPEEKLCDNEDEITTFAKPVSVEWTAKLSGCLASCYGASFTRITKDAEYPKFAGYFADESGKFDWDVDSDGNRGGRQIAEEFLEEGLVFKISGKWIGIEADHASTVFKNKCVPIVEVEKIERIK